MHWTEPATTDDSHAALEKKLWDAANTMWASAALKPSEYSPVVLGKFAMSEGQKGGGFYTPTSIVRLIVEILEPYHGRILDPACGSGGMFIQSARFVEAHKSNRTLTPALSQEGKGENGEPALKVAEEKAEYSGNPTREISLHGQERVTETARLARLNLAVHGLSGDIKQGNTYYEDLHNSVELCKSSPSPQPSPSGRGSISSLPSTSGRGAGGEGGISGSLGRFDFVLANPPFNVSKIDKERLAGDPRYPFGLPRTDNGNYLWIQQFYSALNATGRAGFVMANSAADARASEQEIREKIIRSAHVDVMVAIGPNFSRSPTPAFAPLPLGEAGVRVLSIGEAGVRVFPDLATVTFRGCVESQRSKKSPNRVGA